MFSIFKTLSLGTKLVSVLVVLVIFLSPFAVKHCEKKALLKKEKEKQILHHGEEIKEAEKTAEFNVLKNKEEAEIKESIEDHIEALEPDAPEPTDEDLEEIRKKISDELRQRLPK